jgi:moderate conductance mechanosensitive channel
MRTTLAVVTAVLLVIGLLFEPGKLSADAAPAGVSRAEAIQLLDTLKDPEKLQRFTDTLEAYVKTLPPDPAAVAVTATVTPAPARTAAAMSKKPRIPSPLKQAFTRIQAASTHFAEQLRSITDLPALKSWLDGKMNDATERDALYRGSLWTALIFVATLAIELMVRRLIRQRLIPSPEGHTSEGRASHVREILSRLSVQLAALAAAGVAGNITVLLVVNMPVARIVAFGAVNTYIALRLMLTLLDEFVRAETSTPQGGTLTWRLPNGLRSVLVAFGLMVALQLLSGDIAEELGAPDMVQEALAKCIALIAHVFAIFLVLLSRPLVSSWIQRRGHGNTYWTAVNEAVAAIWPTVAICAIAGSWLVWALDVPDAYREIIRLIVATLAVLLISRFLSNLVLASLDRRLTGFSSAPTGTFGSRLFGYRKAMHWILRALLIVVTLIALTEAWGLPAIAWFGEGHPGHRFLEFTLQLLVLVVVGIVCWEAADLAFERRVNSLMGAASLSRATRLRTLQPIVRLSLLVLIALLVVMTALDAIGINVGPLLAGASIVGVAIGFGSQKLVQDFITGIFLLVEDAMDVGDWVTVAGVSGTVEHISIRTIRLRAGDGSTHLVPFSSVTSVNNTNRGVGNAAVAVNLDPSEDTDRVSVLLAQIALEMRAESQYAAGMQSDLQLWGVDKVEGSMVTLVGQIVCTDTARWAIQREFNRRLKLRLEHEGVKLAIPQQALRITPPGALRSDAAGKA